MLHVSGRSQLPYVALVTSAALWGAGFFLTRIGLQNSEGFGFIAMRFGLAGFVMLVLCPGFFKKVTRAEIIGGAIVAVTALLGYGGIAIALETQASARVAFLSSLYILLVPIIQYLMFREPPRAQLLLGAAVALGGVGVMSGMLAKGGMGLAGGDIVSLLSAVAIAFEIVLLGRFMRSSDAVRLAIIVLGFTSVFAMAASSIRSESPPVITGQLVSVVMIFAIATAYIQFAMGWAQRSVNASEAAIIYATEPVFAGLIGWAVGEALSASELLGGALIILGVFTASARVSRRLTVRHREESGLRAIERQNTLKMVGVTASIKPLRKTRSLKKLSLHNRHDLEPGDKN